MAKPHSTKSPAFQFYPKDFLLDRNVRNMSMTERGVYITLLALCWLDNGLPTDLADLASEVGVPASKFDRMWHAGKLSECFHERDGRYHHKRLDEERKKQADYRRRQSDNASRKFAKPRHSHGTATAVPESASQQSSGTALHLQSASSSSTAVSTQRPTTLVQRRRLDAAYEHHSGLYVPNRAHTDLLALHPDGFEKNLTDWYGRVCDEWVIRKQRGDNPGADMLRFWKDRHNEQWPPVAAKVTPKDAGPVPIKAKDHPYSRVGQ
jgi:uncharacterized protein YdaU (DUF1376 family)